jgi:hypothetical protein
MTCTQGIILLSKAAHLGAQVAPPRESLHHSNKWGNIGKHRDQYLPKGQNEFPSLYGGPATKALKGCAVPSDGTRSCLIWNVKQFSN